MTDDTTQRPPEEPTRTEAQRRYTGGLQIRQADPRGTVKRPRWQVSAYDDEIGLVHRFMNILWRHPEAATKAVELLEMSLNMKAKKRKRYNQITETGTAKRVIDDEDQEEPEEV